MVFETEQSFQFIHWQFITFVLPWIWWRAYSILETNWKFIKLLIKRLENGRWWSKFICDRELWSILKWVWPAGHFTLKETDKNKLFIWTWTWFVPLFNQINWSIDLWLKSNLKLIFWLRNELDLFYEKELLELKNSNSNFLYDYYISREKVSDYIHWRVTEFITKENIADFEEFYLCWIPSMIDNSIELLLSLWVSKSQIFTEKY
jgi:ferredoxin-NADP reductase